MSVKIRIAASIFCFAYLLHITGCKTQITNIALSPDITKYTSHSLDFPSIIGNEYKIISTVVKQKKLLVKATRSDTSFFIGVDLLKGNVFFIKPDPSNDYVSSTFDISGDSIFSLSSLTPSEIFITNIKSDNTQKKAVDFEKATRPGKIVLNHNQIFLLNDVYGVGVVNQINFKQIMFHNEGITGLVNPQSSTLSFPVNSSLNLISGHVIANNTIQLYAIDNRGSIRWRYLVKQNSKREAVSILSFSNLFVVKYDSTLVGLNKEDGKEVWHNTLQNSVSDIYKWQDKILAYCLVNPSGTYPDNEDFEYKVVMKLFDSKQGKEVWSTDFNSANVPHIGICGTNLLVSDNKLFTLFSLNNGTILSKKHFPQKNKGDYAFEMLADIGTGDYYIKSYGGEIYW
ncbi:PQQ-like beta-propeller repeat protein [Niastella caeni]|uniref:PQQ-like beta-propeller repeat protein n=1 Tax=Niastella caeni TaxID=2569763 RepID=A0A4S8HIM5_9BACT|nr:PQQ-binding-like beta-propeller repeat protein [Niastella caeni]THU34987.1 PQQ-like beta-propeller repeat protein [Niastella caeni]